MRNKLRRLLPGIMAVTMLFSQSSTLTYASDYGNAAAIVQSSDAVNYASSSTVANSNEDSSNAAASEASILDEESDDAGTGSAETGISVEETGESTEEISSSDASNDSTSESEDNNDADNTATDSSIIVSDTEDSTDSSSADAESSSDASESTSNSDEASDAASGASDSVEASDAASSASSSDSTEDEELNLEGTLTIADGTLKATPGSYKADFEFYSNTANYNTYIYYSTSEGKANPTSYASYIEVDHNYDYDREYAYYYYCTLNNLKPATTYYYSIYTSEYSYSSRKNEYTCICEETSFTTKDAVEATSVTIDEDSITTKTGYTKGYVNFKINNPNNEDIYSVKLYEDGYEDEYDSIATGQLQDDGSYTLQHFIINKNINDYYIVVKVPVGSDEITYKSIQAKVSLKRKTLSDADWSMTCKASTSTAKFEFQPSKSFDKTLDDNMYLRVFYKTKNSSTY
ncbi:MAG: hypothetical protein K6A23_01870, partial [Butyrivibrio sp.]|nr:hypothetical protein [Butyrivibrio sp.]